MFSVSDSVLGSSLSDRCQPPNDEPQLYLVLLRWWNEAQESAFSTHVKGVSYLTTSSLSEVENIWDSDSEIVMEMRRDDTESSEDDVVLSEYALLPDWMFLRALKWHNDVEKIETILYTNDDTKQDLYSLKIRYFLGKMKALVAKISQKDNKFGIFERACSIFCVEGGQFRIWDFSGQITQFSANERNIPAAVLQNEGIFLELQLYGLSHIANGRNWVKDEMEEDHSKGEKPFYSCSPELNGNTGVISNTRVDLQPSAIESRKGSAMGLTGLLNIGNTCFMNSAIQCLVHTTKFVDYFLGDFKEDLNFENPLGRNGKLALAFGDLFRKLWSPGARTVAPNTFKLALANFAPQFSGYSQHDSQEFLAFLLDGLHEDLNRVKCKPYIEVKDADNVPDNEVADEHWRNHLARNDSIIVDVCQGQFRSKLVCPICKVVSITYDPFMYLSLPLPITSVRTMTLTVLSSDGSSMPVPVTVTVPKFGRCEDLLQAVSASCSLRDDETLLLTEVFSSRIYCYIDNPADPLLKLRDSDRLVAHRLPKDSSDSSYLVVFMHQHQDLPMSTYYAHWKNFGIPLVTRMSDISKGSEIREQFLKLLDPFLLSGEDVSVDNDNVLTNSSENLMMNDVISSGTLNGYVNSELEDSDKTNEFDGDLNANNDFQFSLKENHSLAVTPIKMDEPLQLFSSCRKLEVLVSWPRKMTNLYDINLLSSLPEIYKFSFFTKEPQEPISLYKCLEGFLKEEPLGPEDMWYCPSCKEHREAKKKLDLWRLPEILVVHLKRFSYNRLFKNKLEAYVDFPTEDFNLADYAVNRMSEVSQGYVLYAIINHYGGLGGGHYTAYVQQGNDKWYEFDDHRVYPVDEERIKTSAAYVLLYRRV
ncbi:Ubiquitin carboxyl-terminal hydrolase [Heracleum sosnowskyi]|uniref:Ubiquitin carboxyl-terminal hydrolase n=1 Tax=Heracleum sosnowskyi TaxID=360622 RepID=A0AAD8N665_9APIA|nr:Ubiquitin carboxyl-terminal hydrolase [Heracleum sosnowskyi]KAK1397303.1 Ubiquitin carboxyl-terminal hydrolase [Heracleum sosnowskyi]